MFEAHIESKRKLKWTNSCGKNLMGIILYVLSLKVTVPNLLAAVGGPLMLISNKLNQRKSLTALYWTTL